MKFLQRCYCIRQPMLMMINKRSLSDLPESLKATRIFPPEPLDKIALESSPAIELGANTPVGWIENGIDFLHTTGGMSWYGFLYLIKGSIDYCWYFTYERCFVTACS